MPLRLMPFVIAMAAAATAAGPAGAEQRFDARALGCAAAADRLRAAGAAVVTYGPGLYRRLVSHVGHCPRSDRLRPFFVPTRDDDRCFIGYRCAPRVPPGRG